MARRKQAGHELTEIEFIEGDLADGFDVEFSTHHTDLRGGESEPGAGQRGRSWWVVGGVLAAVLMVVGIIAVTSDDDPSVVAPPSTSRPSRTTVPRTTPVRITEPSPTEVPTSATFVRIVPSTYPPFVPTADTSGALGPTISLPEATKDFAGFGPAGTTLYLWDTSSGPTSLVALNTDTGELTPIELGAVSGPLRAVIPTNDGPIVDVGDVVHVTESGPVPVRSGSRTVTDFTRTGVRVAGGMTGPILVRSLDPPSVQRYDPETNELEPAFDLPPGIELIGTSASGNPIVRGPDLRAVHVAPDGTTVTFSQGIITPVEDGRYAELRCDLQLSCFVSIQGVTASATFSYAVPDNLDRISVRISPSGEYAAIAVDDNVRIVDTRTGQGIDVPLSYVPSSSDYVSRPAANYFRLARDLVWNGFSPFLLMLTPEGIVMLRIDGTPLARIVLDDSDPLRYVPLAIG